MISTRFRLQNVCFYEVSYNFIRSMDNFEKTHVLKFVIHGRPIRTDIGIKCMPRQTYGVSSDSPEHFKGKFTGTGQFGYKYEHQNKNQFEYLSQQKNFSVFDNQVRNLSQHHTQRKNVNLLAFHRKKGRLSEFMDKNGWMSKVIPIMGDQRSPQARDLQIIDRKRRINSLNPKKVYENKLPKPKVNKHYFDTIPILMSEKQRIRKQRNYIADLQGPVSARSIYSPTIPSIDKETLTERMSKTCQNWAGKTKSTFYSIDNKRSIIQVENVQKSPEQWFRTTCNSKWTYKKTPKLDTDELTLDES